MRKCVQMSVIGPLILLALAVFMLCLSWQKWADVLVDFGRELYVPWQLNQGRVLYQDITHLYGPFSHYFNALLFRIFGTGIKTVAIFNIGLIALLTYLIYRFFLETCDCLTATACGATFLSIFAFSQYVGIANYNFVCPYSHELTHGVLLSFVSVYSLLRYLKQRRNAWLVIMGVSTGLVALTKAEVFLALFLALFCGLFFLILIDNLRPFKIFGVLGVLCLGFLLPIIGFWGYFSFHMSIKEALGAIMTPFTALSGTSIPANVFYKTVLGTDKLLFNLTRLSITTGGYILVLAIFILLSYIVSRLSKQFIKPVTFLILGIVVLLAPLLINRVAWMEMARPFPLFMLALGVYLFITLKRCRDDEQKVLRLLPVFVLTVFAFALLLKMLLNTHVFHYGFALAMPAGLLLIMMFVEQLPKALGRFFNTTSFARGLALVLVGIILVFHIGFTKQIYDVKTYPVGSGADTIRAMDPHICLRGIGMNLTLQKINELMDEGDSFVVFPEGVILNYLSRRKNPTPYFEFTPPMVRMLGEKNIIEVLSKDPPDYIVLTDKDTSEHGARYFGRGYAQDLFAWIKDNYIGVSQIGNRPLSGQGFGLIIAKKKP